MASRRLFLALLLLGLAGPGIAPAFADDGGDGGGGDGGGGDGGDNDGNGGGGGNGDDGGGKDGHDDGGNDDGGKDDNDRDGDKNEDRQGRDGDDDRIRNAVKSGKAESLRSILPEVRRQYPGKVVRIRLTGTGAKMVYRIRVINSDNRLIEIRVNAQSGAIIGASNI